jgi:hypothetical protein
LVTGCEHVVEVPAVTVLLLVNKFAVMAGLFPFELYPEFNRIDPTVQML